MRSHSRGILKYRAKIYIHGMPRFVAVMVLLGILVTGLLLYRAPWERVHANDSALTLGSFRAPVWQDLPATETYQSRLNVPQLTIEISAVWILVIACGTLVFLSKPRISS